MERSLLDLRIWNRFTLQSMAILLLSNLLIGSALIYLSDVQEGALLKSSLLKRTRSIALSIGRAARVPLLLEDKEALDALTKEFLIEDTIGVSIMDAKGNVVSQAKVSNLPAIDPKELVSANVEIYRTVKADGNPVQEVIVPVESSSWVQGNSTTQRIGYVCIGLSQSEIYAQMSVMIRRNTLTTLAVI